MNDWAVVADYATQIEAEFAQATLQEAGIPAVIRGTFVGAFGPGFAGSPPFGIRLLVPTPELEHAREVLGLEEDVEGEGPPGAA